MTAFCRHPGCVRALASGNASGLCRVHLHGPLCSCARCAVPKVGRLSDADRRRVAAAKDLARGEAALGGLFQVGNQAKGV